MESIGRGNAGHPIPHCEVVSRTLDPFRDINPSGVARIRWTAPTGAERTHDLQHWLRLDDLLTPGMQFRVEIQARQEATFDLPMFSAKRDFVFTGNTDAGTDVAVGADGELGWVYGVVVVGAEPVHDSKTIHAHDPELEVADADSGWGVVPGGVPAHVLRELFTGAFPDSGPSDVQGLVGGVL